MVHEPDLKRQRLYQVPPHPDLVPHDMIQPPSASIIPVEPELDEMPTRDTPAPSVQVDIPDHVSEVTPSTTQCDFNTPPMCGTPYTVTHVL